MDKVVASPEEAVADIRRRGNDRHRRLQRRSPIRDEPHRRAARERHEGAHTRLQLARRSGRDTRTDPRREQSGEEAHRGVFGARRARRRRAEEQIAAGKMEVELVPQGILVERCRAGGAGIPGLLLADGRRTPHSRNGRRSASSTASPTSSSMRYASTTRSCAVIAPTVSATFSSAGGSQNFNPSFAKAARVRDRRSRRDRRARRDSARAHRSARHFRVSASSRRRRPSTARPGAGPSGGLRTSRGSTTASRRSRARASRRTRPRSSGKAPT